MAKCLGGCGKDLDGMCPGCVEGARRLNQNALKHAWRAGADAMRIATFTWIRSSTDLERMSVPRWAVILDSVRQNLREMP